MTEPTRQKRPWLAPLGWGLGALAVVVASVIAMRQANTHVAERETLRAASAVGEQPRPDKEAR